MFEKKTILDTLNNELNKLGFDYALNESMLDTLVLDVTRAVDDKLTVIINHHKNISDIRVNSIEKEEMRKYLLGYPESNSLDFKSLPQFEINQDDLNKAYELIKEGFSRNRSVMIESIIARIKKLIFKNNLDFNKKYIEYIHDLQIEKDQLIILTDNSSEGLTSDNIADIIENNYDKLSNYHHIAVIFKSDNAKVNWNKISEIAIFMECFRLEKEYSVFKNKNKQRRIDELKTFLIDHDLVGYNEKIDLLIDAFYEGVSYGFQFKDLFITSDGKQQILLMQKIELDESPKKCPSCLQQYVRGNSYPKILLKSFECTNPSCPSRSKIGRGKRYDLLASKRQALLECDNPNDRIDNSLYFAMRRDIIQTSDEIVENLISLYTWENDSVLLINTPFNNDVYKGRKLKYSHFNEFSNGTNIKTLLIYELLSSIADNIIFESKSNVLKMRKIMNSTIINGNSSYHLSNIKEKLNDINITCAVTSPPYYNAREYSQWPNLITYLIDMMINAKAVYNSMNENGTYIYNIGDVVEQDNVYIKSLMSNRRQMLGFYSIFAFNLANFKAISNIIWDKGEVQSKRNSTPNLFAGYVNPVNSYEHCIVFTKDWNAELTPTRVERINTVVKINSKGENTLGHTAPYPEDIPKLIIPFVKPNEVVIDPFLGSGTTCITMLKHGIDSIGFELNDVYFELACERVSKTKLKELSLLDDPVK